MAVSRVFSVLCLALLSLTSVNAATYYVSSSTGSDRNAGNNRNAPWKSFTPIYQRVWSFMPGDSILFCQGDSWFYSNLFAFAAGTATSPITWGSYQCRSSSTAQPIISPSVTIPSAAWSISSANPNVLVYNMARDTIAVQNGIRSLWAGEVRHLGARSPNLISPLITTGQSVNEFYFASNSLVTNGFIQTVAALTQPDNYWVGATIYMRINNWTYQQTVVIGSGNGWLQVRDWPNTGRCSGFYLENGGSSNSALLQVDAPGEFVFNRNDNNIYLWPATAEIRAAILAGTASVNFLYGNAAAAAVITGNNHIIQDINFKYAVNGVLNGGARTFTVRRNTIKGVNGFGIATDGAPNAVINQNIVDDADGDCIFVNSQSGQVSYNNVSRCGTVAGYGFVTGGTNNGIVAHAAAVSYNTVTGTGYNGIEPHYGASVSFNSINNVLQTLNDGGGIYMFGNSGNSLILEGNTISGVLGNWLSWTHWSIASCVFTDQGTSLITVYNNTCSNAPQCMQLNDAYGNLILSNRCNAPGIYLNDGSSAGGHLVIGNQITTSGTDSILQNPIARVYAPGQWNLNVVFSAYYENVYCQNWYTGGYLFQKDFGWNGVWRYNSFAEWRASECAGNANDPNCQFERNSAFYTANATNACASYRPFFFGGNAVSALLQEGRDQSQASTSNNNAAEIAAPVVVSIVAVTLIIVLVIVAARYYIKNKRSSAAAASELPVPLAAQSSRPMSPDVSFNSLPSPTSQSVMVELHSIQSQ